MITNTKRIKIDAGTNFSNVREFLCPRCRNSSLYTEDGFMGHYARVCRLMKSNRGEYEQIVEPDSPNEDGTLDFIVECNNFVEEPA